MDNINQVIKISPDIYSNDIFWAELFRIIYNSYSIEYVTNNKRNYINCDNMWSGDMETLKNKLELRGIKICHKKHECNGHDDCDLINVINRRKVKPNEIKYVFEGKFDFDNERFNEDWNCYEDENEDEDEDENEDKDKNEDKKDNKNDKNGELKNIIIKLFSLIEEKNQTQKISNITFELDKNILIKNPCGFNHDHRGSDHMLIKLPFVNQIELGKIFTLEDLIVGGFNLRSHKFDNYYELYSTASCKVDIDKINVELNFDHGS